MSIITDKINQRERGTVPITIGTSMPFEVLVETPKLLSKDGVDAIVINVRTLVRNIYNCLDSDFKSNVEPKHLVDAVIEDMYVIAQTMESYGIAVHFYRCSYNSMLRTLPNATMRQVNTPLQKHYANIELKTSNLVVEQLKENVEGLIVQTYDVDITLDQGRQKTIFLLTHAAIDLLSSQYFRRMVLIESHTGNVKTKSEWNTKLTKTNGRERMPFNKFTLTLFGDGNTYLSMYPIKVRRVVTDLAEQDKWTPTMTRDKIRFSLMKLKDKYSRDWLLKLL